MFAGFLETLFPIVGDNCFGARLQEGGDEPIRMSISSSTTSISCSADLQITIFSSSPLFQGLKRVGKTIPFERGAATIL